MRRPTLRRVMWVSGIIWLASWFCLGLEIFCWHHVTQTLHLNPPPIPPGYPKPKPGEFLISVLACSALAPPLFLATAIAAGTRKLRKRPRHHAGAY